MGGSLNLVFFKEAVLHCARLSRVLAVPGGHGVLLSTATSIGRTTLVKLASFISHCKVRKFCLSFHTGRNYLASKSLLHVLRLIDNYYIHFLHLTVISLREWANYSYGEMVIF